MVAGAELKAPFPYAGGKSRVADTVWSRFGNVDNYIEPFAGSLAVLLRRPGDHFNGPYRVETINDANHYLVNFWRATKHAPEQVAEWADSPVFEADLHARHKWLVRSEHAANWRKLMAEDPEHYDPKVAGWWVWGQCCWIGGQWCDDGTADYNRMPVICSGNTPGRGINNVIGENPADWQQTPELANGTGRGGHRARSDSADSLRMPELAQETSTGGTWVHGPHEAKGRPQLSDAFDIGRGVNSAGQLRSPQLTGNMPANGVNANWVAGTCEARRAWLIGWFRRLADRLRIVRTCYGHWSRICDSESTLTRLGRTGVFLDPPYPAEQVKNGKRKKSRDPHLYATDRGADLNALRDEVLGWCQRWGSNPNILVAVCGYEGDGYESLVSEGWTVHEWEANGGYANQRRKGRGKAENAKRERIWFSPHCLPVNRPASLFDDID